MPSNLDIYRSAKLLIDQHSEHAVIEAVMRADELLDLGDLDGQRMWMRIRDAVQEIQR